MRSNNLYDNCFRSFLFEGVGQKNKRVNVNTQGASSTQLHFVEKGISPGGEPRSLHEVAVLLHPRDDVAIARFPLSRGVVLRLPTETRQNDEFVTVVQRIQAGHKLALRDIPKGSPILRYGSIIGFATQPVLAGSHVHSHNLAVGELRHDYVYNADVRPVDVIPLNQQRTFMGYKRPDG